MNRHTLSIMGIKLYALLLLFATMLVTAGCQSIQTAACKGDVRAVHNQLSWGVNVNSKNFFTRDTALIEASRNGHLEVVKLLLEKGADVNLRGEAWSAPLHEAAAAGHTEIVQILLDKGAYVNEFSHDKPLNYAARGGHIEVAKLLLSHGADINAKGMDEWTPLGTATSSRQLKMVEFLLSRGADVNAKAIYGCTPLYQAYLGNNIEIGKILLDHGADITLRCGNRGIPEDFVEKIKLCRPPGGL